MFARLVRAHSKRRN